MEAFLSDFQPLPPSCTIAPFGSALVDPPRAKRTKRKGKGKQEHVCLSLPAGSVSRRSEIRYLHQKARHGHFSPFRLYPSTLVWLASTFSLFLLLLLSHVSSYSFCLFFFPISDGLGNDIEDGKSPLPAWEYIWVSTVDTLMRRRWRKGGGWGRGFLLYCSFAPDWAV